MAKGKGSMAHLCKCNHGREAHGSVANGRGEKHTGRCWKLCADRTLCKCEGFRPRPSAAKPAKPVSAVQAALHAATGETSPFSPKGMAWLEARAAEREAREATLGVMSVRPDCVIVGRNTYPDPKRKGLRDGLFFYDYDDKGGKRHLEVCVRRQVQGIQAQAMTEISRAEAQLLLVVLGAFVDGHDREHMKVYLGRSA